MVVYFASFERVLRDKRAARRASTAMADGMTFAL
jgi:hypothetical protein